MLLLQKLTLSQQCRIFPSCYIPNCFVPTCVAGIFAAFFRHVFKDFSFRRESCENNGLTRCLLDYIAVSRL